MFGGAGNDVIHGGSEQDIIHGDSVWAHYWTDNPDYDSQTNPDVPPELRFSAITFVDEANPDYSYNDVIEGGAGDDILLGEIGDDYISGGDGVNYLFGDRANDPDMGLYQGADPSRDYVELDVSLHGNDVLVGGIDSDLTPNLVPLT